ncbi:MAG: hypothetical protein KAT00_09170 [Planctomycetes bacterium]|nr:hypothetical protein [Planctomycetota bacterium]
MEKGQMVKIKGNGIVGKLISIWEELDSATQYRVRYYDKNGVKRDSWFYADDLDAGEPDPSRDG